MKKRRFTKGETVALCVLVIAVLLVTCTMIPRHGSDKELAAVAAADSAYRAKSDSIGRLMDSLREVRKTENTAVRDSLRQARRKKKNAKTKAVITPRERNYLDETLSPSEAR